MDGILADQRRVAVSGTRPMARQNRAEIVLTARDRTKSAFRSVNKGLGRIASIGLAGAAAGTILLTRASLKQIDALAKQARLIGITTEKLAALQLVSSKTGVEQKVLEKALINVTRVTAEAATGTGLAVDTLKLLGLEAKALSRQSPEEQFLLISDAMKGLNTQSEKVLASYELFGGRGVNLLRTLEAGRDAFDEAAEKVELYGTNISAVDAASIEESNDAFTDLAESIKGVGFDLARRFAPGMKAGNEAMTGFVVTIRRDFIPAMALILEQMGVMESNVRGLSDIELTIRADINLGKVLDAEEAFDGLRKKAEDLATAQGLLGVATEGRISAIETRLKLELAEEQKAAEQRLFEVETEQQRRAEIILAADRKLADQKLAQEAEARAARQEADRVSDQEFFLEQLEVEDERRAERIQRALKEAKEFRKFKFARAREERAALITQGKLEERAAAATIRLKQQTAATSIAILQTLVGKNKTVARALFLVEKGLAIARTVQNTAAAAVKALAELGPIAGPPAAAAIQAFGAAQVGLIAATALTGVSSIGGGGGAGAISSSFSGSGGFESSSPAQDPGSSGGSGVQSQGVVQLIFPSLFGITPDAIDSLADALREASENRDIIVVAGTGRNAEILAGANS